MEVLKLIVFIITLSQMCSCYKRCKMVVKDGNAASTACINGGKANVELHDKPAQKTSLQISFKNFNSAHSERSYVDSEELKKIMSAIQSCMNAKTSMCSSFANIPMHQTERLDLIIEESKDKSKFNVIGLGILTRGKATLSNKPMKVRIRVRRSDGKKSNGKRLFTIHCPKGWKCFGVNTAAPATTPCLIDIKRPVTCIVHMTAAPATPPSYRMKRSLRMVSLKGIYQINTSSVIAETIAVKNTLQLVFESLKAVA